MNPFAQWLIIESSNHWWTALAFVGVVGLMVGSVIVGATMIWLTKRPHQS